MALEFEVDAHRLQMAFTALGRELTADNKLVERAALIIERQAKINATGRPGPRVQTGRLRASINHEVIDTNLARVGTNVFYAPFVEFGHRQHRGQYVPPLHKRLTADFAPAYPFLGPTIEQTKDQITGVIVAFGKELGATWSNP